jgi:ABC-type nickel/cobalt efflux system permease component RcnA
VKRLLIVVVAMIGGLVLLAQPASAHPLGNFTVNRASHLVVGVDSLRVEHLQDLAEVPTAQAKPRIDGDLTRWAQQTCADAADAMSVSVAGRDVPLEVDTAEAALLPGQAGLAVARVDCGLVGEYAALHGEASVTFRDGAAPDRLGWREVTAVGDRTTFLASDVPPESPSQGLRAYPPDLLRSPLDQRAAQLLVRPGGPAAATGPAAEKPTAALGPLVRGTDRLTAAFGSLVGGRSLTAPFLLLAALAAAGLGAAHALAPGHGKTVMACYLAGRSEGSLRSAATIGATVTATHTAGVLLLGLLITAGTTVVPAAAYPWLTAVSGALIVGVGVTLLREARRSHGHHHQHHHHAPERELVHAGADSNEHGPGPGPGPGHEHGREHGQHHHATTPSRRGIVAMGLAGGLLPSPSALVVFLGATALGKAWFGVLLVVAFGAGMALTLMATGLLVLHAGRRLSRAMARRRLPAWWATLAGRLPLGTATVVGLLGTFIAIQGLSGAFS